MLTKIILNSTAKMKKKGIQSMHEWARYNKNTYSKIEWDSYIKDVLLYSGFWQKKKKKPKHEGNIVLINISKNNEDLLKKYWNLQIMVASV